MFVRCPLLRAAAEKRRHAEHAGCALGVVCRLRDQSRAAAVSVDASAFEIALMHGVALQEAPHVRQSRRHIVEAFCYLYAEDRIGAARMLHGQAAAAVEIHSLMNDVVVPDTLLRPGYLGAVEGFEIYDQFRRLDFPPLRQAGPHAGDGLSFRNLARRSAGPPAWRSSSRRPPRIDAFVCRCPPFRPADPPNLRRAVNPPGPPAHRPGGRAR